MSEEFNTPNEDEIVEGDDQSPGPEEEVVPEPAELNPNATSDNILGKDYEFTPERGHRRTN